MVKQRHLSDEEVQHMAQMIATIPDKDVQRTLIDAMEELVYYRKRLRQIVARYDEEPGENHPGWMLPWAMANDARDALALGQFDLWMHEGRKKH